MPRMETNIEPLTRRYERIIAPLFTALGAANLARYVPLWLNPLLDRLIIKGHCRALGLLCKLAAGLYRQPRPRTTLRTPPARPDAQPATPAPRKPKLPTSWNWFTRALPLPVCAEVRACGAELQLLLCEPAMAEIFAAAPALRHHLRPLCRAFGVTLPGEPLPPDAHGPEPEPPPAIVRPLPEPGWTIAGRTLTPAESRAIDEVACTPPPRFRPDRRYFPFARIVYW